MKPILLRRGFLYLALSVGQSALTPFASAQQVEWSHMLDSHDAPRMDVSADGLGNIYLTGHDYGSGFYSNAYLRKYDEAGSLQWTRDIAWTSYDEKFRVSADKLGNVYVLGLADDSLGGVGENLYLTFVAKFDPAGAWQWTRELTPTLEFLRSEIATDGLGNFYVTGRRGVELGGPFPEQIQVSLSKFDEAGSLQWTRQFGEAAATEALSVAADALGNVYVGGYESGVNSLEANAFVAKYDAAGEWQWKRELDSTKVDYGFDVSVDGLGNVYLAGNTGGNLEGTSAGGRDAFVAKYDTTGTLQWTRQFGSPSDDYGLSVAADGLGNVFLSGATRGDLGGPNHGETDTFVAYFDSSGSWQWTRQFGSHGSDESDSIATDGLGNAYFTSVTGFPFWSPDDDLDYAVLSKIKTVPEPGGLSLAGVALALGTVIIRKSRKLAGQ